MGTVSEHVGPGAFAGYTLTISGMSPGVSPGDSGLQFYHPASLDPQH